MDARKLYEVYSDLSDEKLLSLALDVKKLDEEAIPILQAELIKRDFDDAAVEITRQINSKLYYVKDEDVFNHIVRLRGNGLLENEVDQFLMKDFPIDKEYIQLLKSRLKMKGKGNIFLGTGLVVFPILFGLVIIVMGGYMGGIWVVIFIVAGIWKIIQGIKQVKPNVNQ